jgi:hypothetical protein
MCNYLELISVRFHFLMRHKSLWAPKVFLATFIVLFSVQFTVDSSIAVFAKAPQRRTTRRQRTPAKPPTPKVDYTKFSHASEKHKLECKSCHTFPSKNWKEVRKGADAFPDVTEFPEHQACLNCHRAEFFARERPAPRICSNCHVAISPRNTTRFPFPSRGAPFLSTKKGQEFVSEFKVAFPHDKHVDVVGQLFRDSPRNNARVARVSFRSSIQESANKGCAVCHETYQPQGKSADEYVTPPPKNLAEDAFWLKKGAFKTTPTTHAACATCHNEEAGIPPAPADCAGCHKIAPASTQPHRDFESKIAASMGITDWVILRQWSRRSTGRYRHEFDTHAEVSCTDCHNPAVMNLLVEQTLVSVKSCGGSGSGCHVEATTDGILNYEIEKKQNNSAFQCVKCHIILGKNAVPADHLDAIKPAKK